MKTVKANAESIVKKFMDYDICIRMAPLRYTLTFIFKVEIQMITLSSPVYMLPLERQPRLAIIGSLCSGITSRPAIYNEIFIFYIFK